MNTAANDELELPREWREFRREFPLAAWQKPVILLGGTDTGKSTFGRWLYRRLLAADVRAAYLHLDPGQNDLGPPTTLALGTPADSEERFPPTGRRWLYFVGSNSPRGHLLRLITGLHRLRILAWRQGYKTLLVDTSGFITWEHGGHAIKWAEIELLRPCIVVAFQRHHELESILAPLRHLPGVEVVDLPVAAAVRRRSQEERQASRAAMYRRYFQNSQRLPLSYRRLPVFPQAKFTPGQLLALEEKSGLTVALGIVEEARAEAPLVWLHTPWSEDVPISAVRLGDLRLDLETYQDSPL